MTGQPGLTIALNMTYEQAALFMLWPPSYIRHS